MKNKLLVMTKLLLIIFFIGMIVNIPHTQAASGGKVTQKNYSLTPSGALYINADKGKEPVVTQLDQTLIIAVRNCDFDYVQTCLNQGANPNVVWHIDLWIWTSPISAAIGINNTDARVKMIDLLIERGANPIGYELHHENGRVDYSYYVFEDFIEQIPYWLDNGVPANLTIDYGPDVRTYNYSLINRILSMNPRYTSDSILENQKELIQLLVNNGADINSQYYKSSGEYLTPLMQVIVNPPLHGVISDDEYSWQNIDRRNLELFQFLIDLGADVRIRNKNGISAKDLAVKFGRLDMVKILTSIVPFTEGFTMSEMSIGGIAIGSDLSDVEKLYGKPTKIEKKTSNSSDGKYTFNLVFYSYNKQFGSEPPELLVSAEDLGAGHGKIYSIASSRENFSTPKGLRVGMSLKEAAELYQMQPERNKKLDLPGLTYYSLTPLDKEDDFPYDLFFWVDQNNIIRLLCIGHLDA